ncbi:MLO-like protein 8 [Triticum urartu]|uniref:MLO-like protein n=1 Tax=Triticum urartu TaxID=4572 RepID=M8AA12_TRIUA|nr:MLO-like protein 8 [Triticum urartu]
MGGGEGAEGARALDQTPTWAVVAVCAVIVAVSILLEGILHHLGQWFSKRKKKALFDALEKVKSELMTLGFISLLLTVTARYISRICIPAGTADTMLPCKLSRSSEHGEGHGRRHLSEEPAYFSCPKQGYGVTRFNRWATPATYLRVLPGRLPCNVQCYYNVPGQSKDPSKFRLTHQTSFVRQHASCWSKSTIMLYVVSFFRQFFRSVRRTDYLTLRHGFIAAHLSPGTRFNFQKYIKRSLQDDFKTVVGISPPLWASALAVMLFNVHGWHNLFWFSTIPLIVILAVGTKLQAIIARMAVEITEKHTVIQGMPVVKLSDEHFWFGKPHMVLHLIHFALFQNAFEITYFFWIWYEFGLRSCFHDNFEFIIARICLGGVVQFVCSYITLPLHALVSQMGSSMKRTIFDEQTSKALKKWHKTTPTPHAPEAGGLSQCQFVAEAVPVANRHLHRYKTIAHVGATRALSDSDCSDTDAEAQTRYLIPPTKQRSLDSEVRVDVDAATPDLRDSFSFQRPPPAQNAMEK